MSRLVNLVVVAVLLGSPRVISDKRALPGSVGADQERSAAVTEGDWFYELEFEEEADSVTPRFSGFDKSVNSSKESFFVTNPHSDSLKEFTVEITYRNMEGKMLHKREVTEKITIPSNETRRIDITSWDIQHQFYYHRTMPTPKRTATPFKVHFRPIRSTYTREAFHGSQYNNK